MTEEKLEAGQKLITRIGEIRYMKRTIEAINENMEGEDVELERRQDLYLQIDRLHTDLLIEFEKL